MTRESDVAYRERTGLRNMSLEAIAAFREEMRETHEWLNKQRPLYERLPPVQIERRADWDTWREREFRAYVEAVS